MSLYSSKLNLRPQADYTFEFKTPDMASAFADAVVQCATGITCRCGHVVVDVWGGKIDMLTSLALGYGGKLV